MNFHRFSWVSWIVVGVAVVVGIIVTKSVEPLFAFSIPMAVTMLAVILDEND